MDLQYLIAMLICITAVASFINNRYIHLPKAIGLTIFTLFLSLGIMSLLAIGQYWVLPIKAFLGGINFNATVMDGMISYLLFAGALHINAAELIPYKKVIISLATTSVLISCFLIGYFVWTATRFLHVPMDFLSCLLFGALIAPTDPVCVLSAMKNSRTPQSIRMKITGESIFNDAAGILLFFVIVQLIEGKTYAFSYGKTLWLLVWQGGGGILLGYSLGIFVSYFLRRTRDAHTAVLMTLAVVTGGYSVATFIKVSGPICMVLAGLVIGSQCRKTHFTKSIVSGLYNFWGLIDGMLNSCLFVLIGLELLTIDTRIVSLIVGAIAFFIIILTRIVSVTIPTVLFESIKSLKNWRMLSVMTLGGMRGGLSIALALSIPDSNQYKSTIIGITYTVVVFSIILQGLSLQHFVNYIFPEQKTTEEAE
ncbi:MAG: sodium:proton antiporter [Legionellales bacterium]|nr:MAG: sodium:proton antiporter [Legionellales bacterium]